MSTVAFVQSLVEEFPELEATYTKHLKDQHGEILPHVFFGDLTRFVVANSLATAKPNPTVDGILKRLERAFRASGNEVDELIIASFLENLPNPGEPDAHIRDWLGPKLKAALT